MKKKQKFLYIFKKLSKKDISVGLVTALLVLVLYLFSLGLVTIPVLNLVAIRMSAVTFLDIIFAIIISFLTGIVAALYSYISRKKTCSIGAAGASSGAFLSYLTVICPVCNLFLFSLLGISFTLSFLSPFILELRIFSVALLILSIYWIYKKMR